jgi:hypothetical protein
MPVFLVIVLIFLTNTTINRHFHRLSSGYIISHAHPFSKGNAGNPFQDHHHTTSELIILDQISHTVFWIYLFILLLSSVLFTFTTKDIPFFIVFKNPDLYFLKNYRAPPGITY